MHGVNVRMVPVGSALLVTLVMLGSSCTGRDKEAPPSSPSASGAPKPSPAIEVTDISSFVEGFEAAGFTVRLRPTEGRAFPSRILGVPGQAVLVDGDRVSTFEFPTQHDLTELMRGISPRGDRIPTSEGGGTVLICWEPPRFYGAGRLLVLYFGDKHRTLQELHHLLGAPFAGVKPMQ